MAATNKTYWIIVNTSCPTAAIGIITGLEDEIHGHGAYASNILHNIGVTFHGIKTIFANPKMIFDGPYNMVY